MVNFATPSITQKEIKKVNEVLASGWITTGKLSKEFGKRLADKIGAKYCLPVSSCTAALHVALVCAGVSEGDEVITTPMTFVSTLNVIKYLGARPVLVDIKPEDYIIDEEKIEQAVTKHTKAILPVHYGGYAANLESIRQIARKYKLEIIEDAAHAYGSKYKNEYIGQKSKYACFSFYPTKNITTIEGGALVTNSKKVYERASSLALHGISRDAWKRYSKEGSWRYDVVEIGYKYNMTDVQAAVGLEQLERIETMQTTREKIYKYYQTELLNLEGIEILPGNSYSRPFRHLLVVKLDPKRMSKDTFIEEMKKRDIICSVHFIPIYHFKAYEAEFAKIKTTLKETKAAHESCVSLPFSSNMTLAEAQEVVIAIRQILAVSKDDFLTINLGKTAYNISTLEHNKKLKNGEFYSYITPYQKGLAEECGRQGFKYISSRVEMEKNHGRNNQRGQVKSDKYLVSYKGKKISKGDLVSLRKIGKEVALTSRFYKDEQIGEKAYKIYDKWITNSFLNDYANDYVVIRHNKTIVGFATLRDSGDFVLDLIGVRKEHQGGGVGKLMLAAIANKYPGRKLKVGTEAENVRALDFYVKSGFRIAGYKLVFHKHT